MAEDKSYCQWMIDLDITNGLGYDKVPHFNDSQLGLVRHLASIEMVYLALEGIFCLKEVINNQDSILENVINNSSNKIVFLRDSSGKMKYAVEVYQGNRQVIFDSRLQTQPL